MSFAISGAGIGGLILALALKKQGINCTVYEQAAAFDDGVGGGIGLYPNGLRVIRDISRQLLLNIRAAGRTYVHRRWMRPDGSEIAVGSEKYLCDFKDEQDEADLSSMAIRRWRLQKCLVEACAIAGIPIVFGKRINSVEMLADGRVKCVFATSEFIIVDLLFGADGVRSACRAALFGSESGPKYTGVTCLMGSGILSVTLAPIAQKSPLTGICFPASPASKCHACFYPANDQEIIFQIYFPTEERPESWKALSEKEGAQECRQLAQTMKREGWGAIFTDALENATSVLRTGLRARSPIPVWHAPETRPRVILLGDAAHPPVPYIGQGAMMAIEDAGILSLLIAKFCKPAPASAFNFDLLDLVVKSYEGIRLPRTTKMLAASTALGDMQLARSSSNKFETWLKELGIWVNVKRFGTLPVMLNGAGYNYKEEVEKQLFAASKL